MRNLDRERINSLMKREEARFVAERPKSRALFEQAKSSLIGGVPMQWMTEWAGPFPIFAKAAHGAHITDVDGHRYLDLCLGDTGSMFGHSPAVVAEAVAEQARQGITLMLPTEESVRRVGESVETVPQGRVIVLTRFRKREGPGQAAHDALYIKNSNVFRQKLSFVCCCIN